MAYLLAFANPSGTTLNVWAVPEPLLYNSLSSLPLKESGQDYTIQIYTRKQRIDHCANSPDLTPYFQEFPLSRQELLVLKQARKTDAVRKKRAAARRKEGSGPDVENGNLRAASLTRKVLATVTQRLAEAGEFDPSGITDARERILASIVRRRGQPTFRNHLLTAYKGQCAISGCNVEPVLEAAHIVPYKGPQTNHPSNGLLLRGDLHALFDLHLLAIDGTRMTVLLSPSLAGTCYEEFRGRTINVPDDPRRRPSSKALEQHRHESGL
jgi:hypothetical protein